MGVLKDSRYADRATTEQLQNAIKVRQTKYDNRAYPDVREVTGNPNDGALSVYMARDLEDINYMKDALAKRGVLAERTKTPAALLPKPNAGENESQFILRTGAETEDADRIYEPINAKRVADLNYENSTEKWYKDHGITSMDQAREMGISLLTGGKSTGNAVTDLVSTLTPYAKQGIEMVVSEIPGVGTELAPIVGELLKTVNTDSAAGYVESYNRADEALAALKEKRDAQAEIQRYKNDQAAQQAVNERIAAERDLPPPRIPQQQQPTMQPPPTPSYQPQQPQYTPTPPPSNPLPRIQPTVYRPQPSNQYYAPSPPPPPQQYYAEEYNYEPYNPWEQQYYEYNQPYNPWEQQYYDPYANMYSQPYYY